MDRLDGVNLSSSLSIGNLSTYNNDTGLKSKIYVFLPISSATRLTLLVLSASVGIIAFVGNVLILCFVKSKQKTTTFLKALSFQKNFDVYISSLAVSDTLCAVIVVPLCCSQLYVDFFQRGWGCKILRYMTVFFPCVTINNLLIISIGKYFSIRENPRVFKHSTVRKVLCFAWLSTCFYVLIPVATFSGIRHDLNDTHYTVSCNYNDQYLPFKIISLTFITLQYFLPCIVIIIITTCLIFIVRSRTRKTIDIQRDNAIKAMARAANRRATVMLITIMLAFVIPYSIYLLYAVYDMITRPQDVSFQSDYIICVGSAILAYSNGVINVIIYLVQMKTFRCYLKTKLVSMFTTKNSNSVQVDDA